MNKPQRSDKKRPREGGFLFAKDINVPINADRWFPHLGKCAYGC